MSDELKLNSLKHFIEINSTEIISEFLTSLVINAKPTTSINVSEDIDTKLVTIS
jgi:hypothetical protein